MAQPDGRWGTPADVVMPDGSVLVSDDRHAIYRITYKVDGTRFLLFGAVGVYNILQRTR